MNILLIPVGLVMTGLILVSCGSSNTPQDAQTTNPATNTSQGTNAAQTTPSDATMTEIKAKEIALTHAGVTDSQATFLKVKLDYDDGVPEYEVEFLVGNTEYDYEIHAVTGDIRSFDQEVETSRPSSTTTSDNIISESQAKEIALTHAGVTDSQATFLKVKLDYDDGVPEYEVEFLVGNTEYDYEIHAVTGDIRSFDQEVETARPSSTTTSDNKISESQAKEIALTHAGVTDSQATFLKVKLDYDDGIPEYEVEFLVGNTEYDYEIHAVTGDIRSFDQEVETSRPSSTTTSDNIISESQAKEIALTHAGVTDSQATFLKVKLDYDDGVPEYEVEFLVGNTEYDYEIHAVTGDIRSFDQEVETSRPSSTTTSDTKISESQAKEIALTHAGVTDSQATFLKVKLDYDDGVPEYEVEFLVGNTEYDYEIHAVTGDILSHEQENKR